MTREDIEQLNIVDPFCFESDREEQWYNVGLKDGLYIADEHPKSSWINCKDKLPFEFENLLRKNNRKCTLPVLVYNKKTDSIETDFMIKELYYWDKKIWSWYFNDKNHITHWMPLPDKPQI